MMEPADCRSTLAQQPKIWKGFPELDDHLEANAVEIDSIW